MLYSCFREFFLIILWLIKSNDKGNTHFLKYGNIIFRSEWSIFISDIQRPWEGNKFTGYSPVEISIFNFFIVLVLNHIKCIVVIPVQSDSKIKTFQTMFNCAFILACSHGRISKRSEFTMVWFKDLPGFISIFTKDNYHKSSH